MKLFRPFLFLLAFVNTISVKAQLTVEGIVKHAATTSTATTGNVTLNVSGGTPPYSYSWSPGGSASATLSSAARNNYTVTVNDAGTLTATYPYSLGYKTKWIDLTGMLFRNDSLISGIGVSKNTLPSNTDGWAEFVLGTTTGDFVMGFTDSLTSIPEVITDIDFGVNVSYGVIHCYLNGYGFLIGTQNIGDVIRIERDDTTFNIKQNGIIIYSNSMPVNKNYKLKAIVYNESKSNIGASFLDTTNLAFPNYVQDFALIKHCSPGSNNGSISLTPKISGTSHTYSWSPGSYTTSAISGLSVSSYTANVKDPNLNSSKHVYNVGYKTSWKDLSGLVFRNDSMLAGIGVTKNTLLANTDGWSEYVLDNVTSDFVMGFTDSLSLIPAIISDIDFGVNVSYGVIHYYLGGYGGYLSQQHIGDVIKIERVDTMFNIKQNDIVIFSTPIPKSKNYKLKAIMYAGSRSNIGASFMDSTETVFPNYVRNIPNIIHASGAFINDGSITLSPKSGDAQHTYTWTATGENSSKIENRNFGTYNVTIADTFQNSSNYNYDILFKTKWTNLDSCFVRNDSVISSPTYPYLSTASGKNILKANTDGEITWVVDNISSYRMIGFADTLSNISGDYYDLDQGIYEYVGSLYYAAGNGTFYYFGTLSIGDIFKIKRQGDTLKFYQNNTLLYSTPVTNANVDWKIKTILNPGNLICNVGCSFNTELSATVIKEHADYDNLHNGFAYIIPDNGAPSYKVSWVDGMISDTRNDLSVGSHIATITDSTETKVGKDFAIGVKPVWNISTGVNYMKDSIALLGGVTTGEMVSYNTSFNNEAAWFEFKVTDKNTDLGFGFIGNPKTAMDTSYLPAVFTATLMEQRLRHANQLYNAAITNSLTYAGGRLVIDSSATNLFFVRLYNGNLLSLVNTATTTQYPINNGDVIRIGRNEDGNFFLAVNGNVLVKYSSNINDQYLVSSFLTNAAKVKVSQVGIYTKVPLETYPEHIIIKDPKCLNDVCHNWSSSVVYNESGNIVSASKQYYDNLGRPTQAQQKVVSENNILANEVIYDSYGRTTGQTLPAPLFSGAFCYNPLFFTNSSNQHYGVDDFDKPNTINKYYGEKYNPAIVGNSNQGTLGWYYSNNNTSNLYVPADSFPYNRVEYYNDPLNRVYKTSDVGRFHKMGSGHETQTFYLSSGNELQAIYQKIAANQIAHSYELNDDFESLSYNVSNNTLYNNNIYKAHKTVQINEDGHDYITYTNSLGQVLATCNSGYDASCGSFATSNSLTKNTFLLIHLPKQENNSLSLTNAFSVALTNIIPIIRLYTTKQVLALGTDYTYNTTTGAVTFLGDFATGDLFIEVSYDHDPSFTSPPTNFCMTETHKTGYTNWTVYYYDVKGRLKAYISPNDFKCPTKFSASVITTSTVPSAFSCDPSTRLATLSIPSDTTGNNTAPDVSIQFKPIFTSFDTLRTVFSAADFYLQTNDTLAPVDTLMALSFFKTSFQDSLVTDTVTTARIYFNDSLYQIQRQLLLDSAFKLLDGKEIVYKGNYVIGKTASGTTTYFDSLPLPFNYTVKFVDRQAIFENNLSEEYLTYHINAESLTGAGSLVIKCDSFKIQAKGFYNSPVNFFNPCNQSMWVGEEDAKILATLNSNINLNLTSAFIISPAPTTPPSPTDFFTKKFYYNKYDHLVATETKDEGRTDYFYDLKEDKLFYTQNDKQRADGGKFNYMKYDDLGRVIESGEYDPNVSDPSVMFNFQFQTYDDYDNAVATNPGFTSVGGYAAANDNIPATLRCTQATNIEYAKADASNPLISTYPQHYLNGKISKTYNDKQTTWYSYDEEGQLEYSVQDMAGFATKTMDYSYDFFGNPVYTTYQLGQSDEFKHLYTYDADLNLKKTQFTRPGFSVPEDAALYSYYLHGPLKRQVLGNRVQGLDYVYTIRGALKSVNEPFNGVDPGADGTSILTAKFDDFFSYALDYYPHDYERGTTNPMAATNLSASYSQLNISYTGQISAFRWNRSGTTPNTGISTGPYIYEFNYDELYRLKSADYSTYGVNSTNPPTFISLSSNSFKLENITYDKIGNIQTLKRYAKAATGNVAVLMDDLTYNYNTTIKNRLKNVADGITGSLGYNAETDLKHQSTTNNYGYDAIGQVTLNVQDNQRFEYNASGLVTKIIDNTTSNSIAEFEYNDKGLRSAKTIYSSGTAVSKRFYVYDAGGGQVASYERTTFPSGTPVLQDFSIYSGGRIGLYDVATTKAQYELTDHLGNVRTVFTDGANYATAILQTSDYYPHGAPLAGANYYSTTAYRYGHQGQERDAETGFTSFELRQLDPRLGRWISTDPYAQHHSPYISMANNPVNNIDPDGGMDYEAMKDPNAGQYGKSDAYMQSLGYSQTAIQGLRLQMYGNFSQHQNFKPADCSFEVSAQELKIIAFTNYLLARQVEKAERKALIDKQKAIESGGYAYTFNRKRTRAQEAATEAILNETQVFEYSYISSQTSFTRTPLAQQLNQVANRINAMQTAQGQGLIDGSVDAGVRIVTGKIFGDMYDATKEYGNSLLYPKYHTDEEWNQDWNQLKSTTLEDLHYGSGYLTGGVIATRGIGLATKITWFGLGYTGQAIRGTLGYKKITDGFIFRKLNFRFQYHSHPFGGFQQSAPHINLEIGGKNIHIFTKRSQFNGLGVKWYNPTIIKPGKSFK